MPIEQYAGTVRRVDPPRPKPAAQPLRLKNNAAAYVLAACTLALCIHGSVESARRMAAERWIAFPADDSLERAVELTPGNGLAWLRLGQVSARRGDDPRRVIGLLERAVALETYSSEARIALALQLDRAGDFEASERQLLRAAGLDRSVIPAIALANFYVRRGDAEQFWRWLREAAGKSPAGLAQAVELCWRAVDDPAAILEKGVPDTPEGNRYYLGFVLSQQRLDAAEAVWERMRDGLQPGDASLAAQYVGQLLDQGNVAGAVAVWNRICSARLVSCQPLSPKTGPLLTNGAFERDPTAAGFDWRIPRADGIYWTLDRDPSGQAGLAIQLEGNQAEKLLLLEQIVPVAPSTSYRLSFRYRTAGLPDETGIWAGFADFRTGAPLAPPQMLRASGTLAPAALTLRVPAGLDAARLVFGYERAKGTSRQKGTIWLGEFEMLADGVSGGPPR
jgi:tetratricopeptide (TPR) repeat protein